MSAGEARPGSNGTGPRMLRARVLSGLIPFVGLVLLWMLLWGQFTWLALATGVLLASLVSIVFYLPAVRLSGRFDLVRAVVLLAVLLFDIVRASLQVAWSAIRPRYTPSNAIIAVPLVTRSDLIMTFTAVMVGLVPGSIVLDIDRDSATLHLHTLNVASVDDVPALKRAVLAAERRLILAVGSADDLARLRKQEPIGQTGSNQTDERSAG
ncbi:Na+/H+ antiporter subunit E [Subtercola boreus]|uniref:Na+/H+ antiporter subunit E n=1 Tax=Subtercola boreus TaxID=120213 RepID=A0A3E0VI96_9MICO|nr:Na+/H+ antiporter subunit E [Subtercola boreus]RFA09188.1 Na+/H+ antiporter subunit E [Subtercola boreus]TQL53792.1 multisubunit sodium/proton antiporter MrpE subunit [Subtercola boreus]